MDWLSAQRTWWGSLPEKVLANGAPAGPAPLAWTASLVILTAAQLDVQSNGQ
jgi:glucoamylase